MSRRQRFVIRRSRDARRRARADTMSVNVSVRPRLLGRNMADIERIGVDDARRKVTANQALLVCAYDDDAKCRMVNLEGSMSLTSFRAKAASLPKDQEIIFFCA